MKVGPTKIKLTSASIQNKNAIRICWNLPWFPIFYNAFCMCSSILSSKFYKSNLSIIIIIIIKYNKVKIIGYFGK